jgi:hypothetical protein
MPIGGFFVIESVFSLPPIMALPVEALLFGSGPDAGRRVQNSQHFYVHAYINLDVAAGNAAHVSASCPDIGGHLRPPFHTLSCAACSSVMQPS